MEDCDIFKYVRNAREAWVPYTVGSGNITVGGNIQLPTGKTIPIGELNLKDNLSIGKQIKNQEYD